MKAQCLPDYKVTSSLRCHVKKVSTQGHTAQIDPKLWGNYNPGKCSFEMHKSQILSIVNVKHGGYVPEQVILIVHLVIVFLFGYSKLK
jgi:hypothetical protein